MVEIIMMIFPVEWRVIFQLMRSFDPSAKAQGRLSSG
jgi:hypothetical protein